MNHLFVLSVLLAIVISAYAAEYQWGECNSKDYRMAKDKVTKKAALLGLPNSMKYVYKQKNVDARTITCIIVKDRKKKCDATVELETGGIGSKGVTLKFKGKRGGCIQSYVEIYTNKK